MYCYTNKLFYSWEMELHRQDKAEVLKCWRLHLGCSGLTAEIIDSVCDTPSVSARCRAMFHPLRDLLRLCRRKIQGVGDMSDTNLDKMIYLVYYTVVPFISASLFYLEQIKNIVFAVVFYHSVMDYTNQNQMSKGKSNQKVWKFSTLALGVDLPFAPLEIFHTF